jgi:pimeloyl-ACP methyl ester carboxylesterase
MPSNQRWERRAVMRAVGASLCGSSLIGYASAQSESASLSVPDQESDGNSIVVADASTPVEATLSIVSLDLETTLAGIRLEAGASFSDRAVELDTMIRESQRIQATIVTPDGKLASDVALVAVGESLSSARESTRVSSEEPDGETKIIDPEAGAGFGLPYALYEPETVVDGAPILVEPLNDPEVNTEAALQEELRDISTPSLADDLGVPALVPGLPYLPRPGNDEVSSLELPSINTPGRLNRVETDDFPAEVLRRVDRQVVEMIRDAKERLAAGGHSIASTVHIQGFSASAQFASRFAFLYPQLVNTIALGGNGAYPLPKATHEGTDLPYPLGTANYEAITGRAFDRGRWAQITQYIYLGREDQPSPNDESDYYSISGVYEEEAVQVFGQNRVTERFPTTRSAYEAVGANATFRIYDGLGHETSDETREAVMTTHQQSLDTAGDWPAPTNLLLEVPDTTATPSATPTPTAPSTPGETPRSKTVTESTPANPGEQTTTGASGPGFGPLTTVTSLGTVGYLLGRRAREDTEK